MSREPAIVKKLLAAIALVLIGGLFGCASATAAGFTVTVTPGRTWCFPQPNGAFLVSNNDPPYFSFQCSSAFVLRGDPIGQARGRRLCVGAGQCAAGDHDHGRDVDRQRVQPQQRDRLGRRLVLCRRRFGVECRHVDPQRSAIREQLLGCCGGVRSGLRVRRRGSDHAEIDHAVGHREPGPEPERAGVRQPLVSDAPGGVDLERPR